MMMTANITPRSSSRKLSGGSSRSTTEPWAKTSVTAERPTNTRIVVPASSDSHSAKCQPPRAGCGASSTDALVPSGGDSSAGVDIPIGCYSSRPLLPHPRWNLHELHAVFRGDPSGYGQVGVGRLLSLDDRCANL